MDGLIPPASQFTKPVQIELQSSERPLINIVKPDDVGFLSDHSVALEAEIHNPAEKDMETKTLANH